MALIFVIDVSKIVALTVGLAMVLVVMGYPAQVTMRRTFTSLPDTLGSCWLFGLGWVSILSWYAFTIGISIVWAYRFGAGLQRGSSSLAGVTRAITGLMPGWGAAGRRASLWAADTLSFLACVLVYAVLAVSKVKHGSLPWLTVGNNDLLAYLKMGNYLRHFPNEWPLVNTTDMGLFVSGDVFGAFNLISLGSFTLSTGVENFAIPAMAFAIGSLGMAIARCCRRIFRLGASLSLLIAIVTITCPLMSYVTLNYFLGQMLLVATLVTTTLLMVEVSEESNLPFRVSAAFALTSSIIVMLCYPPWLLQYLVIISGLMAILGGWRSNLPFPRWVVALVLQAVGGVAVVGVILCLLSFARFSAALTRLVVVSKANIAGWPLSFVNLDLLLGWPDDWRVKDTEVSVVGQSLAVVILVALVYSMLRKIDHGPGHFARALLVTTFAAAGAAYLAIWFWFGVSYQQWKFATTIPLGFGFVISAAVVYILLSGARRRAQILIRCAAASVLTLIVAVNIQQFYLRWSVEAYDFPMSLSNARMIDLMPGVSRGYVKMDDYLARMGAAVFVRDKPVSFSGPTYWGEGSPPPSGLPFVEVEAACRISKPSGIEYVAQQIDGGTFPVLPLDTLVPFTANIDSCVDIKGFSGAESWGRWTDDRHASIRFACNCDLSRDNIELVIETGAFLIEGRVDIQKAFFRVNGAASQEFDLTSTAHRKLNIKVPPELHGDNTIDVEIDLPDAVSPTIVGSQDTRILGLSVISLELRKSLGPSQVQ